MSKYTTFDLLYQKYLTCMGRVIPDSLMKKEDFTAMLSLNLDGMSRISVCDDCPEEGFLYYAAWADEVRHCAVPVYGYYAANEKTAVRLFQQLAEAVMSAHPCGFSVHTEESEGEEKVMAGKSCEFSIHLYRNDFECINAFHMMQFGTMSEQGITELKETESENAAQKEADAEQTQHKTASFAAISVLSKREISEKWDEIWRATDSLVTHLRKSPVFYPGTEFTEAAYRDFFLNETVELIAATEKDKMIGIIEWNQEKNKMLASHIKSVNVGEAFVYPEYRGTGLAQRLLSFAKERAYRQGARYMWVEHGTANPNARGFWNKYFTTYRYELVRRIE